MKEKIVFVSSRFPLPLIGGFEIKNYHLIKSLSRDFDVSAHFIQRALPDQYLIGQLSEFCDPHIHLTSLYEVLVSFFRNFFLGEPLQNALYFSSKAQIAIGEDLKDADVAVCSVIRTCDYIEKFPGRKIYDLADSLGQVYASNIPFSRGWRRFAYQVERSRLLRKESNLVKNSHGVLFFNAREASLYSSASNVFVVPHGVSDDISYSENIDSKYSDGLTFIGKLDVAHNVDMVLWFAKNVLPLVPSDIRLYLIGANPSPNIISLARNDSRVIILGYLNDPYVVLRSSIASICPLITGGGIQNKVIESLACGAITIASSKAMEALSKPEESGVIVCDIPLEWANTIINLFENPESFNYRRSKGRVYSASNFSWSSYGKSVINIIRNRADVQGKSDQDEL